MSFLQNVTIVGAGTQGAMLAFRSAAYGRDVVLYDVSDAVLDRAQDKCKGWFTQWVREDRLTAEEAQAARQRIHTERKLGQALQGSDLVIECVPERLELKQQVWEEIDRLAPPHTLLTTNSSSLKASDINIRTKRKELTCNINFMTPVTDDMVEVMFHDKTSPQTRADLLAFLRAQENVPVVTRKEIKGFSLNRVWRAIKKECLHLWADGYISPEAFDRAWMLDWHTDYGPFGLMDKVGLDIVQQIEMSYYDESHDPADLPPKALEELIAAGHLGEKSGQGFYSYPNPAYEREGWLRDTTE